MLMNFAPGAFLLETYRCDGRFVSNLRVLVQLACKTLMSQVSWALQELAEQDKKLLLSRLLSRLCPQLLEQYVGVATWIALTEPMGIAHVDDAICALDALHCLWC